MDKAGHTGLQSISQYAGLAGISERTARRWAKAGKLALVDIGGRIYVQPEEIDRLTGVTGVDQADNAGLRDRLEDALTEQVRTLRTENDRLWREVEAKQQTIDRLTLMLPAPVAAPQNRQKTGDQDQARRGAPLWVWLVLAAAMLAAVGGCWLWLTPALLAPEKKTYTRARKVSSSVPLCAGTIIGAEVIDRSKSSGRVLSGYFR